MCLLRGPPGIHVLTLPVENWTLSCRFCGIALSLLLIVS